MADYDVFNGDADGILSLVQLRLADPRPEAKLVTGRKRDIDLLKHVDASKNDRITVLDISMRNNGGALLGLLEVGAQIFYADHHNPGDIPEHENLTALIDTSSEMCTAMLIDAHLSGAYRAWAVTAAFGDNFPALAKRKAQGLGLPLVQLEQLGILINYNGYGASVEDLHFHPANLYKEFLLFETPMEFLDGGAQTFEKLNTGYREDMKAAKAGRVISETETGLVIELADTASSRRVSGVYGNQIAQNFPDRAHAVLTHKDGGFVVSVRAPLKRRTGADTLCLQFETGGGRSAAAGINHLPEVDIDRFVDLFQQAFMA